MLNWIVWNRTFFTLKLYELELISLHIVKWFKVLLFNISYFIYQEFQSNLIFLICLYTVNYINYLFAHRQIASSIANICNTI